MSYIKIRVVEKTKLTYLVHLLNTDAKDEHNLYFDLAERQELPRYQDIMEGISRERCWGSF